MKIYCIPYCFRLTGRTKYQTKEEVLEGIYIDSTVSCFADINRTKPEEEHLNEKDNEENRSEKEDAVSQNESRQSRSACGSWPNLNEDTKQTNLSEDSIGHSRNPSEIDSLDSNYVRKHYNFEAHLKNYNNSSPETERSVTSQNNCKDLYITTDDHDSENEIEDRPNTPKSVNNSCNSIINGEQTNFEDNPSNYGQESTAYDEISIKGQSAKENVNQITESKTDIEQIQDCDNQSVISENDGTVSSPTDSITSYISISIASSDKSHKLEYLANSLAEKIDEYCDSHFQENTTCDSKNRNYNTQINEPDPVYSAVQKKTTFADIKRDSLLNKNNESNKDVITKISPSEIYVSNTFIGCNDYDKDTYCTSTRNITTEPFVTTLIENQYYSLPDINIGKCLRKSERIDARLREEDPEDIPCENTYEVAQSHFREIFTNKGKENYGHLNKINISYDNNNINDSSDVEYVEKTEPQLIQNFSKLEDDLKSIITIDSSIIDESNSTHYYQLDHHQNEREVNEIEGTIRNNKVITKSESLRLASNVIQRPEVKILKSFSNDNINKSTQDRKVKTGIKKHYSLRQRNPTDDDNFRIPSPSTVEKNTVTRLQPSVKKLSFSEEIRNNSLLSRVQSFKTSAESNIAIVPLSGHQTIVIDPPLSQQVPSTKEYTEILPDSKQKIDTPIPDVQKNLQDININLNNNNTEVVTHLSKDPFITIKLKKVVKQTIPKLNCATCDNASFSQQQLLKPPSRLIINDSKNLIPNSPTSKSEKIMTRPQVLQVIDSKNKTQQNKFTINEQRIDRNGELKDENKDTKTENNVKEKLNIAIKTDMEYQEKINSVKTYWSKLIDKSPEVTNKEDSLDRTDTSDENKSTNFEEGKNHNTANEGTSDKYIPEVSVGSIIKSLERVKIVDSIRKLSQTKLQLWKDESEKVKSDSEIDEPPVEKIFKEDTVTIYDSPKSEKIIKKHEVDMCRDTPEIEIVELSNDDNQNQKTQATLIKAKGYEKGCDEFDHVRYKVMKSELFKNSMIANYRKEAQFDGLLQYLQDYSFQELLVNNNIVIIEPVRTKVEPTPRKNTTTETCKIPPTLLKKHEYTSHVDKSKNAIRRHFFYHPIRVNKEIIEEELPNPDTVKKVRNLFEDTLKMKSPMGHDPPLVEENVSVPRRATSYRNLSEETKSSKVGGRKKITRQLTIDTNFGIKKWDNASLSSGVSSGDLSSNNEYETDGLSPYSQKTLKDNVYSSSDEYLCDSASQDFCCESQYVSPDILKKIRECGTSVTYYGGKVLNSKTSSTVSPMTKAIMEEIKSLQKNCSRDCYSCQTKCKGEKCSCLISDKHQQMISEKQTNEIYTKFENNQNQEKNSRSDNFPGFKFKLVKSNSCSSRLELTGTDETKNPRIKFRKQNSKEDPPIVYDDENSVKNKICRLESYNKGIVNTPFPQKEDVDLKPSIIIENGQNNHLKKNKALESHEIENHKVRKEETVKNIQEIRDDDTDSNINNKQTNESSNFENKFYYVNENKEQNKVPTEKFGEMVFEEFEVLETSYDSLNSTKSLK